MKELTNEVLGSELARVLDVTSRIPKEVNDDVKVANEFFGENTVVILMANTIAHAHLPVPIHVLMDAELRVMASVANRCKEIGLTWDDFKNQSSDIARTVMVDFLKHAMDSIMRTSKSPDKNTTYKAEDDVVRKLLSSLEEDKNTDDLN